LLLSQVRCLQTYAAVQNGGWGGKAEVV